ncbi:hypothetical protein BO94DRAFT_542308 [Aspergillus sclerotioniger CBS 115572]|uniref:Uncharacterized protein n=1 Tax=Aspergillus sclerotioniger CBS 115572 TaxID=1450535 RepID=A0A317X8V3_9EURO|nr:hypothetical protein BO94DRAFT_542308 [Aspergillus sclerotioniger CBS 115572]PWY95033.1 hypothetical protein BO94DRAFT_542308 [Aspergillus sclerotioniger CBS 115572]
MEQQPAPRKKFTLIGNHSKDVIGFPKTASGSGNAVLSEMRGGVHLLRYFLKNLLGLDEDDDMNPGSGQPNSFIELFKSKRKDENDVEKEYYQVRRHLHVEKNPPSRIQEPLENNPEGADIDDVMIIMLEEPCAPNGGSFGEGNVLRVGPVRDTNLNTTITTFTGVLVCKMPYPSYDGPRGQSPLMEAFKTRANNNRDTVIIIDADDLRRKGAKISRHLSWAKTAEDLDKFLP